MSSKLDILLESSGIIPHIKTKSVLEKNGWKTLVSPYYHDNISGSMREADLLAEKQFNTGYGGSSSVHLNIQLFVECKFIQHDILFWFENIDISRAKYTWEKETGLLMAHQSSGDVEPKDLHQVANTEVAKIFSSNANNQDVIYKALSQSLHSLLHYRNRGKRPILCPFLGHSASITQVIQYPIIVCGNFEKLHKIRKTETTYEYELIENHFVLETNYGDDYFLVDIVDLNHLDDYLVSFVSEADKLMTAYDYKRMVRERTVS